MGRRLINGECGIFRINDPNNEIIFTHKVFIDEDSIGAKLMTDQKKFDNCELVELEGSKN